MDKRYEPLIIEEKWSELWAKNSLGKNNSSETFSQVIPPPNVTGTLHMGHSFQYSIMDFYARYNHLNGVNTHWQMGTDHAGIATQMVVENNLSRENIDKNDLGREDFVKKVWEWKQFSEDKITGQIKRLGNSVDWSNYRFTLDEGFNEAVLKAFVELYRKEKIYRGYRLVNWDPSLKTAVSDLEVVRQEKKGLIWFIKYPIMDSDDFVTVATTRPETMFGDMAIAVNPKDKRYKDIIGKKVELPFVKRKIPIIGDDYVDREFGTGCLKITPGHDFNDYEIGKKYCLHCIDNEVQISDDIEDFEPLNIFTDEALGLFIDDDSNSPELNPGDRVYINSEWQNNVPFGYEDLLRRVKNNTLWLLEILPDSKSLICNDCGGKQNHFNRPKFEEEYSCLCSKGFTIARAKNDEKHLSFFNNYINLDCYEVRMIGRLVQIIKEL